MPKITIDFLARVPLFRGVSAKQLGEIAGQIKSKHYKKQAIIFIENEPADRFFIVYLGQVKIFKLAEDGKTQVLNVFGSGDVFGEVPMFTDSVFPAHCEATQESEILSISRATLLSMIDNDPRIAVNIIKLFAKRLKNFTLTIENLTLKNVTARFAVYLLHINNLKGNKNIFELDISKTLIADLLGISRETLSRTLNKMIKQNLITMQGKKVSLLDIQRLEALAVV